MAKKRKAPKKPNPMDSKNIVKKSVSSTRISAIQTSKNQTPAVNHGPRDFSLYNHNNPHPTKHRSRSRQNEVAKDNRSRSRQKHKQRERSESNKNSVSRSISHCNQRYKAQQKPTSRRKGSNSVQEDCRVLYSAFDPVNSEKSSVFGNVRRKWKSYFSLKSNAKKMIPVEITPLEVIPTQMQKDDKNGKKTTGENTSKSQLKDTPAVNPEKKSFVMSFMPDKRILDPVLKTFTGCLSSMYEYDSDEYSMMFSSSPNRADKLIKNDQTVSANEKNETTTKRNDEELDKEEKIVVLRGHSGGDGHWEGRQSKGIPISAKTVRTPSSVYPDFHETMWEFGSKYKLTSNSKQNKKQKKRNVKKAAQKL